MKLDRFVASARAEAPRWDVEREARLLAGVAARREQRVARGRAVRRGLIGASAACTFVFALLRAGAAPASANDAREVGEDRPSVVAAADPDGDGGYGLGRD